MATLSSLVNSGLSYFSNRVKSIIDANFTALNNEIGSMSTDVVNDTTPQLGGDLDTNDNAITLKRGSLTDLSLNFQYGDTDTGIYAGSGNRLRFATNGVQRLHIHSDGTLSVETPTYEALVTDDDDIPNKKYVDDSVGEELWNDMIGPTLGAPKGAAAPTDTVFGPTGTVKMPVFAVNDSIYMAFHIPHDIKPGSTAHFHVHWATDGTHAGTTKWEISYTVAKGHGQEAFGADTVLTIESGAATATAWYHEITEDATGFTLPEVDSLILCTLKRITNGGTDNSDDVFGLFMDIHYQRDRDGTPYKAPNFYTGP